MALWACSRCCSGRLFECNSPGVHLLGLLATLLAVLAVLLVAPCDGDLVVLDALEQVVDDWSLLLELRINLLDDLQQPESRPVVGVRLLLEVSLVPFLLAWNGRLLLEVVEKGGALRLLHEPLRDLGGGGSGCHARSKRNVTASNVDVHNGCMWTEAEVRYVNGWIRSCVPV
ncbi:hypothetical protein KC360_g41 [Hortaea werneckii]|nr:hypothetical protein KC360_g41 [Hortaea werneckii]